MLSRDFDYKIYKSVYIWNTISKNPNNKNTKKLLASIIQVNYNNANEKTFKHLTGFNIMKKTKSNQQLYTLSYAYFDLNSSGYLSGNDCNDLFYCIGLGLSESGMYLWIIID